LRCVPSSSNQQPENLTKQTLPFPADYPFRSQEKEPIRKRDAKRNNQSTPSKQSLHSIKSRDKRAKTHTSFNMSRKSKSKDQTKALNIPFTLTQGDLLQEALAVTFAKDQTKAFNIPFTLTQGNLLQEALVVTFAKDQTQAFEHSGQSTPRRWTIRRTHRMEWQ
jgi:hypothetical protein